MQALRSLSQSHLIASYPPPFQQRQVAKAENRSARNTDLSCSSSTYLSSPSLPPKTHSPSSRSTQPDRPRSPRVDNSARGSRTRKSCGGQTRCGDLPPRRGIYRRDTLWRSRRSGTSGRIWSSGCSGRGGGVLGRRRCRGFRGAGEGEGRLVSGNLEGRGVGLVPFS